MKHALIFDLDGTLVDSLSGIAASLNRALMSQGLTIHAEAAVQTFIGDGARMLARRAAPTESTEALIDLIEQSFKSDYDEMWKGGTFPYEGISALLEILQRRKIPLAVLSNKPHAFTVDIVAAIFPNIRFSAVVGQRDGIPHKPDPAGALEIAHVLQVKPENCVVIGDSTMDIETAERAAMRAIAVTWGFQDRDRLLAAGADQFADTPQQLLEQLMLLCD